MAACWSSSRWFAVAFIWLISELVVPLMSPSSALVPSELNAPSTDAPADPEVPNNADPVVLMGRLERTPTNFAP
jgi:hypothetical protein